MTDWWLDKVLEAKDAEIARLRADIVKLIAHRDRIEADLRADLARRIEPLVVSDDPEEAEGARITPTYVLMTREAWDRECETFTKRTEQAERALAEARVELATVKDNAAIWFNDAHKAGMRVLELQARLTACADLLRAIVTPLCPVCRWHIPGDHTCWCEAAALLATLPPSEVQR